MALAWVFWAWAWAWAWWAWAAWDTVSIYRRLVVEGSLEYLPLGVAAQVAHLPIMSLFTSLAACLAR